MNKVTDFAFSQNKEEYIRLVQDKYRENIKEFILYFKLNEEFCGIIGDDVVKTNNELKRIIGNYNTELFVNKCFNETWQEIYCEKDN